MINQNILNELNAHYEDDITPVYFLAIQEITPKTECNQDYLEFNLVQINQDISDFIDESTVIKKLTLTSSVDIDENDFISSKLKGFISKGNKVEVEYQNSSHYIEVVETKLSKTIDINFSDEYSSQPSIIINIDKEFEKLYRSYTPEYKKNNLGKYTGVKIFFNNLKSKSEYPSIKINIIGDEIGD